MPESGRDLVLIATVLDDSWRDALLALAVVVSRSGYRVAWFGEALSAQAIRDACVALRPAIAVLASNSRHFIEFLGGVLDDASDTGVAIAAMSRHPFVVDGVTWITEDALDAVRIVDSLVSSNRTKPHLVVPQ
jgi:hypothetical protein